MAQRKYDRDTIIRILNNIRETCNIIEAVTAEEIVNVKVELAIVHAAYNSIDYFTKVGRNNILVKLPKKDQETK